MHASSDSHISSSTTESTAVSDILPAARWSFYLILLCFLLSGFAALLYQTVWMRQFAIIFGTSEFALAVVLAAYMAGLSAGAAVASRVVDRIRRPVLAYGALEVIIAISALAVPLGLSVARYLLVLFFGGQPEPTDAGSLLQLLFVLAASFVIIMIPTSAMGATLPLLTRHAVRHEAQIGSRVGLLYAINTLGAVAGTLTAAFILLPAWGLQSTTLFGAATNLLVFLLAFVAVRLSPDLRELEPVAATDQSQPSAMITATATVDSVAGAIRPLAARVVLPVMLVSGAVSFAWEIVWTRLLAHILGGSLFAFATMLASFLVGITLGSAVASRLATDRNRAGRGLAISLIGSAMTALAIYHLFGSVAQFGRDMGTGEHAGFWANVPVAIAILLPSTLFIGATYPFAVRLLATSSGDAARASARVYAWNTVGAITGSLLTGMLLLPAIGFSGTALTAIVVSLLLAIVIALGMKDELWVFGPAIVAALLAAVLFRPERPDVILRMSPFQGRIEQGETLYTGIGRSASVYLTEHYGDFYLRTNGLPEATIAPRGALSGLRMGTWLSVLPVLAFPEAQSMAIIGLGGGAAAEVVPPSVRQVDVFELEPKVVEANQRIAALRDRDPLSDPRVRVICNDARNGLALTSAKYDIVVSQPSHPWTAGASHLYTQDFMQEVRQHLTEKGVFVQWIGTNFVDRDLLRSLGATLLSVYPHVRLYRPGAGTILFLASAQTLDVEHRLAATGQPIKDNPEFYHRIGIHDVNDVASMLTFDTDGLTAYCRGAPVSTDNRNLMAMHSPRALRSSKENKINDELLKHDLLLKPDGLIQELDLQQSYLVHLLSIKSLKKRNKALIDSIEQPELRQLCEAVVAYNENNLTECRRLLEQILVSNPTHQDARIFLGTLQMLTGQAPRTMTGNLPGPAAAVAESWKHSTRRDWSSVARLDEQLKAAVPSDFYFQPAIFMRAVWRIEHEGPGQKQLAEEAIRILDQSAPLNSHTILLFQRARAGLRAADGHVVVGTIEAVIRLYKTAKREDIQRSRATLRGVVAQCETFLDQIDAPTPYLQKRIDLARRRLRKLLL